MGVFVVESDGPHIVADLGDARPYALARVADDRVLVSMQSGEVALVRLPGRTAPDAPRAGDRVAVGEQPGQVVVDDRGGWWCAVTGAGQLVRVEVGEDGTLGVGQRVAVAGSPYGLAADATGLWFSLLSTHELGHLSWSGVVTRTSLPPASFPAMVDVADDDGVWVALNAGASVVRVVDGRAMTTVLPEGSAPVGLACAGDAVWVADIAGGRLFRVSAPTAARMDTWTLGPTSRPHAVVADPDGGCWFTEWGANVLGHVDATGTLVEHDLSALGTEPHGLVLVGRSVLVAMESGAVVRLAAG